MRKRNSPSYFHQNCELAPLVQHRGVAKDASLFMACVSANDARSPARALPIHIEHAFTFLPRIKEHSFETMKHIHPQAATQIPEPPLARFLFADTRMAWLWLIVRVYVGYEWFTAGWEKLTGTSINITTFGKSTGSAWVFNSGAGAAMKGFAQGAIAKATGAHPGVQGWYANFLQTF